MALRPVRGHGDLYRHPFVNLGQMAGLGQHARFVGGRHFGADRPLDQFTNLADQVGKLLVGLNPGLGAQAGVGGHPVHQAQAVGLANLIQVGGVDKEFHNDLSSYHKSQLLPLRRNRFKQPSEQKK